MTDYWRTIQRRLHEESALHYPRNKMRLILRAYVNGMLNKMDEDSRMFFNQNFLLTTSGYYLDERGAEFALPRKEGKFAKGTATFKSTSAAASKITIPKNTLLCNINTGQEYVTTSIAYINAGETSVTVPITGIATGSRFNAKVGEVAIVETENIPSTVAVVNEVQITGGVDGESDDEYRRRLFSFISTNLSIDYLKKQGIIFYAQKNLKDDIRTKMTSLNPYMNNVYCTIPPNDTVMKYILKDIIYYRIMQIFIKGW